MIAFLIICIDTISLNSVQSVIERLSDNIKAVYMTVCSKSFLILTKISLASFLWDKGKQNSPRCDAEDCGVPSGAILFALKNFFIENELKMKNHS